jgi:tRNA wybutosine-synthesizing protein 3
MAATLYHAKPVLAAASHAGFRESGLQSLRCLDYLQMSDPDQQSISLTDASSHSPIVAVRSSGLALESVIGYCEYRNEEAQPVMRSLVTEEYLRMLVALANDRFDVNKTRVARFRSSLLDFYAKDLAADPSTSRKKKLVDWEDPQARRERKRAEGLKRQAEKLRTQNPGPQHEEIDLDIGLEYRDQA